MTVWVVQQPKSNKAGWQPDFSSAATYGKIEFVFDSYEKVYALPTPATVKAKRTLKDFNPETDYLLWPNIGDPMAMVAFMLAFCIIHLPYVDEVKFLQWSRKRDEEGNRSYSEGFYVPVKFNLKVIREQQSI